MLYLWCWKIQKFKYYIFFCQLSQTVKGDCFEVVNKLYSNFFLNGMYDVWIVCLNQDILFGTFEICFFNLRTITLFISIKVENNLQGRKSWGSKGVGRSLPQILEDQLTLTMEARLCLPHCYYPFGFLDLPMVLNCN